MNEDPKLLKTLRAMAWRRARGELEALLETFWDGDLSTDSKFHRLEAAIATFVKTVEENELQY